MPPAEGSVEPLAAAQALLGAAQGLGATIIPHNAVQSLSLSDGHVTGAETAAGRLDADEVVVAAGTATVGLAATVGLTLSVTSSPALLIGTQPHTKCLNGLVMSPEMQLRQTAEGRLVAAANFKDDDDGPAAAAALFEAMRAMIDSGACLSPGRHVIGHRPMPSDGFPAVGRPDGIDGLYVAVMHSGITLAPAIGRFVADEVLTGRRDSLLAPYGLGRLSRS